MATYLPNATNINEPVASRFVASAAAEFRALKTYVQGAVSSAAYAGIWASLTGSLPAGRTVAHASTLWLSLAPIADVTLSEPAAANVDWLDIRGLSLTGGILTGPLEVPTGAIGAQVKRAEEIVWSAPVTVAAAGTAVDVTGIPQDAVEIVIGLSNIGLPANGTPTLRLGNTAAVFPTTGYASVSAAITTAASIAVGVELTRFDMRVAAASAGTVNGTVRLDRLSNTGEWGLTGIVFNTAEPRIAFASGRCNLGADFLFDRLRLALVSGSYSGGSYVFKWRRS